MRRAAVLVAATLLAAGCGGSSKTSPVADAAKSSSPAQAGKSSPPTEAVAVVEKLRAAGLPITDIKNITAADDPDQLLGTPNGYSSKATFSDTRIAPSQMHDTSKASVDKGGAVEVFADEASAQRGEDLVKSMESAAQLTGKEWDYLSGPILLRLSFVLTPDEAEAYQKALG